MTTEYGILIFRIFLLCSLGVYQITANNADWQDEFSLEQSWENQNILSTILNFLL